MLVDLAHPAQEHVQSTSPAPQGSPTLASPQLATVYDVVGVNSHVLHAECAVELEVLVDLRSARPWPAR